MQNSGLCILRWNQKMIKSDQDNYCMSENHWCSTVLHWLITCPLTLTHTHSLRRQITNVGGHPCRTLSQLASSLHDEKRPVLIQCDHLYMNQLIFKTPRGALCCLLDNGPRLLPCSFWHIALWTRDKSVTGIRVDSSELLWFGETKTLDFMWYL